MDLFAKFVELCVYSQSGEAAQRFFTEEVLPAALAEAAVVVTQRNAANANSMASEAQRRAKFLKGATAGLALPEAN